MEKEFARLNEELDEKRTELYRLKVGGDDHHSEEKLI